MKCITSELTLETPKPLTVHPEKLRGFIASKHLGESLYHQHTKNGLQYRYPLIHYHILNGKATITGWLNGVEETKKLFQQIDHLSIGDTHHLVIGKKLVITKQEFGLTDNLHRYRFVSPWLALNKNNYSKYMHLKGDTRKFLEKILIGNILSASKGLNYIVEGEIKASMVYARQIQSKVKGTPLFAFQGIFETNFNLPDFFGLGKSVSRGFGAVRRV